MRTAILVVCMIPLLLAGCGSKSKRQPDPVVASPLKLDPTKAYELPSWWTNGDQLLHLGDAGTYTLYEGINRYRPPAQRGQWWQRNYAAITLEPYAEPSRQTIRGSIRLVDQALVLELPGLELMMGFDSPPLVAEDRLLGPWTAEFGSLRLGADRRYFYSVNPAPTRSPAEVGSHGGAWHVEDEIV
ncbi:MAG: hypothetical protein ACYSU7_19835, partial [Planctomycetota bacterium]